MAINKGGGTKAGFRNKPRQQLAQDAFSNGGRGKVQLAKNSGASHKPVNPRSTLEGGFEL